LDDHEGEEELNRLAKRLVEAYPNTHFYTSHCTGDNVFDKLKGIMGNNMHSFLEHK